jgi:hypothetical protein
MWPKVNSGRGSSRLHPASDEYIVDAVLHGDAHLSILSIVESHADVLVDDLAGVDPDLLVHRTQRLDKSIDIRLAAGECSSVTTRVTL